MSKNHGPRSKGSRAVERRLVPLSVWLCSDATSGMSKAKDGPRITEAVCGRHHQAVGRELARHLIEACTRPGGIVTDVFTMSETVLVAAAEMGRLGVGCVPRFPVAQHLVGRLRQVLSAEQRAAVRVRPHGPQDLREALLGFAGRVELLIAALPPYPESGRPGDSALVACPLCRSERPTLSAPQLGRFLEDARHVLAPDGHLAVITTARHERGRLVDLAPGIIRRADAAGLAYVQHVIAVRVPVEGDALVVQPGPAELAQLRRVQSAELPPVASVHADVLLFARTG
ncbi:DNA methyltransferase [Nonomuraea sp. NPDC050790]|uniref:DNA methyltransferase n=1 Tax=Nonomuraea sp. NPDC050790 TaxID=3364371 RepID=UPI0037AEE016